MSQLTQAPPQLQQQTINSSLIRSNLLQRTAITPIHNPVLQRCSNGVECPECRQKRLQREGTLQRAAVNSAPTNTVPPIVHDVLNSSGQVLDAGTRAFMEPRFGYDFSHVRVHTDARAAESARSVNALAYTVGRNVVFGTGQYAPGTGEGRRLLAHELTHVVQQKNSDRSPDHIGTVPSAPEHEADAVANIIIHNTTALSSGAISENTTPVLSRLVASRSVHCPPNHNGAPDDPVGALTDVDNRARDFAQQIADSFASDATSVATSGIPASPSPTFVSYQQHFGLPPAVRGGFLNRLTGVTRSSQEIAIREELRILSRRFALIRSIFSQSIRYTCESASSALCADGSFAGAARGITEISLCPTFWTDFDSNQQASTLIHEAFHIFLASPGQNRVGEINDAEGALRGPGMNFNIAGCYENILGDIFGFDPQSDCPD